MLLVREKCRRIGSCTGWSATAGSNASGAAPRRLSGCCRHGPSPVKRAPRTEWAKRWDGIWRVVTFDLPEVRHKERHRLSRALRGRQLGFLQRSVWVWPHDVQPILNEIIETEGVPECFCGFQANKLLLCTDAEIVASAWDFVEITRSQRGYLTHLAGTVP
jgi:DNA-binding transcriptional regulator PaaX